ncbi:uncharacterized protein BJX67DRAFT_368938 [Aspergillus lucknowensis]|uniref:Uncharacterized protein n=1 Tax=Aspergillus lucknowensis TaxID=176173 RepID=A0ABR4L4N4_9EURO
MPNRQRPAANMVVCPEHLFCLQCFRTALRAYDPDDGELFEVSCRLDAVASILCAQCSQRNSHCDNAPAGIIGDFFDFALVLRFCKEFWTAESDAGVARWDRNMLPLISLAVRNLAAALASILAGHRREHDLTQSRKKQGKARQAYRHFCAERRMALSPLPRPGRDGTPEDLIAYHSARVLRLEPGDVGFTSWAAAKHACFAALRSAIVQFYGDEEVAGVERLEEFDNYFPLVLDEI